MYKKEKYYKLVSVAFVICTLLFGNRSFAQTYKDALSIGEGLQRSIELHGDETVDLFMDGDTQPWEGTYVQNDPLYENGCGPVAGRNLLKWYGLDEWSVTNNFDDEWDELQGTMKTNHPCEGFEWWAKCVALTGDPIIAANVAYGILQELTTNKGSRCSDVKSALEGYHPDGYSLYYETGNPSLPRILKPLSDGNPVLALINAGRHMNHYVVITGVYWDDNELMLRLANKSSSAHGAMKWDTFLDKWSLRGFGDDFEKSIMNDIMGDKMYTIMYYSEDGSPWDFSRTGLTSNDCAASLSSLYGLKAKLMVSLPHLWNYACFYRETFSDSDDDGIPNNNDNCPYFPNPNQEDADNDGIGDHCDYCPNDRYDDIDGDGICGDVDNCPNTRNVSQWDSDGDGQGDACDPDKDNDGIPNEEDNCPKIPNNSQANSDDDPFGDACDLCPSIPSTEHGDLDGDGLGDACDTDRDGDGILNEDDECPDDELERVTSCLGPDSTGCFFCPQIRQDIDTAIDYRYRFLNIPCDPLDISRMEAAGEKIKILISTEPHNMREIRRMIESFEETIVFLLVDRQNRVIAQEKMPIAKLLQGEEIVLSFIPEPVPFSSRLTRNEEQPHYSLQIYRTGGITDTEEIERRPIKLQIIMKAENE